MRLIYRPIVAWPGEMTPPGQRASSPFRADFVDTMELLDRELFQLGTSEAVVQLALPEYAFRLDGSVRKDRGSPGHPGVILSFEAKRLGPLQYATDVYEAASGRRQEGWRQNLRAIALGLEALRKVDRYGISRRGEQYAGWKQLGAGTPMPAGAMTVETAARFLVEHGEWGGKPAKPDELIGDPHVVGLYYRAAAKSLHPDAGGNAELFRRLQEAKAVLDAHG